MDGPESWAHPALDSVVAVEKIAGLFHDQHPIHSSMGGSCFPLEEHCPYFAFQKLLNYAFKNVFVFVAGVLNL